MFTFTPTELQVSSSCNMTNQLLRNHLVTGWSDWLGSTASLTTADTNSNPTPLLMETNEQLGSTEVTEANHTIYITPGSPV